MPGVQIRKWRGYMPKVPKRKRQFIPKEYKFNPVRWTRVPAKQSHTFKDPRSSQTRVRITMYVDLDVLNYFKESDTPRVAGGLMSGAASKAVTQLNGSSR